MVDENDGSRKGRLGLDDKAMDAKRRRIVIVSDDEIGREHLKKEFERILDDKDVVVYACDRWEYFAMVDSRKEFGKQYDDFFVFALPREPRTIIYTEKDKSNSFFKEINAAIPLCGGNLQQRDIRKIIIVVYSWGDAISDKSIRHRRIDAIYESGIQPDLRIFQDVLFSLKDFSFNSEQKRVLREVFGMKFAKGGGMFTKIRQVLSSVTK
ncbi:uncharacterized protein [Oscarella lobularis]|uniref:uncharacterized protein isoform X2 n=1 Tax=Oscarella lobularis TaxID=121494 RepID=UPI00331427C4